MLYKVYINDDPGLIYINDDPILRMGKTVTKSFNGVKLAAKDNFDRIILLMKRI